MGCSGCNGKFGLISNHQYTLMGAVALRDKDGKIVHRLLKLRNPWGQE